MIKREKLILVSIISVFISSFSFAETAFTGYTGGKLELQGSQNTDEDKTELKLQAFFSGQFNFTPKTWSHLEFSIDTKDLLTDDIFKKTDAKFRLDEFSITHRSSFTNSSNYFSGFVGTYEPIGSDILLQRYFGIEPIASKIADSWLGIGNSVLYPQFGIGIADILKSFSSPTVFGGYLYVNSEDNDYKVINFDLRGACYFHYFTCDTALGIGAPMADKNEKGEEVYLTIQKLYWHAGTTMLLGNNYTNGFFFQGGINNAVIKSKSSSMEIDAEKCYLLLEPRFRGEKAHCHLSFYSFPKESVEDLLFIENTLGLNLNVFSDFQGKKSEVVAGFHLNFSYEDKYISSLFNISEFNKAPNVILTPYFSTDAMSGTLNALVKLNFTKFTEGVPAKGIAINIGYKRKI